MGFGDRVRSAWNAFRFRDKDVGYIDYVRETYSRPASYGSMPFRQGATTIMGDKSLVTAILNRIAIDASMVDIRHIRVDDDGNYLEDISSGLNNCLTVRANIDQAATAFRQDMVFGMLTKGAIAIVPVDTTLDPTFTQAFDVKSLRVGEIRTWYPKSVEVALYNDHNGLVENIILPKNFVAIVYNPLYAVMNEPNSTLSRLKRKLSQLDMVDSQAASGKLDLIIQLPYTIKSDARKEMAQQRTKDIEMQLKGSAYGIAYADATEKITQLNRPAENQLKAQVDGLTTQLYAQLGVTDAVMNGTANEEAMLNYNNRTIKPILRAIVEAMGSIFLSQTAQTQNQAIDFFIDPFELMPISAIAEIADKFTRNEIMVSNEIRAKMRMKPRPEPTANELRNKNLPVGGLAPQMGPAPVVDANQPEGGINSANSQEQA